MKKMFIACIIGSLYLPLNAMSASIFCPSAIECDNSKHCTMLDESSNHWKIADTSAISVPGIFNLVNVTSNNDATFSCIYRNAKSSGLVYISNVINIAADTHPYNKWMQLNHGALWCPSYHMGTRLINPKFCPFISM